MKSKVLHYFSVFVLFMGLLTAFSPHAFHSRMGFEENESHIVHVLLGIAIALIGLGMLIFGGKAKHTKQKV